MIVAVAENLWPVLCKLPRGAHLADLCKRDPACVILPVSFRLVTVDAGVFGGHGHDYSSCFSQGQLKDFRFCLRATFMEDAGNFGKHLDCSVNRGDLGVNDLLLNLRTSPAFHDVIPTALLIVHNRVLLNRLCNVVRSHGHIIS